MNTNMNTQLYLELICLRHIHPCSFLVDYNATSSLRLLQEGQDGEDTWSGIDEKNWHSQAKRCPQQAVGKALSWTVKRRGRLDWPEVVPRPYRGVLRIDLVWPFDQSRRVQAGTVHALGFRHCTTFWAAPIRGRHVYLPAKWAGKRSIYREGDWAQQPRSRRTSRSAVRSCHRQRRENRRWAVDHCFPHCCGWSICDGCSLVDKQVL